MELVTIQIEKPLLEHLVKTGLLTEYKLIKVSVKDDLFEGDELHKKLLKDYLKLKKELNDYEFNKRHKMNY